MTKPLLRRYSFAGGVAILALALSPPFDRLGDDSFAWHMVEHVLLLFVVPAAVLVAQPFEIAARIAGTRYATVIARAARRVGPRITFPAGYLALVVALWGTHFSPLYEAALTNDGIHALEHVLYLVAGTLFWLPVISPAPLPQPPYPLRAFYLFLALPQGALLGLALFAAREPLYAHYAELAPAAVALADQQTAAAVMWIAGGLVLFAAILCTIGVWAQREVRAS